MKNKVQTGKFYILCTPYSSIMSKLTSHNFT